MENRQEEKQTPGPHGNTWEGRQNPKGTSRMLEVLGRKFRLQVVFQLHFPLKDTVFKERRNTNSTVGPMDKWCKIEILDFGGHSFD